MRESRIENELQQIRQLPYAEVVQCMPKGISCNDVWILWVLGKEGTLWEHGRFPVKITFPSDYPKSSPKVQFDKDFKHVHVYEGGMICMPLLQPQYWKIKTSMSDIIQRIINIIHQDINPYSPANSNVFRLFREEPNQYQKIIKEQTKRYENQSPEYFQEACIHINIMPEE